VVTRNIPIVHVYAVASVSHPLDPPLTSPSPYQKKVGNAYSPTSPTIQMEHWWQSLIRQYPFFEQQGARDCEVAKIHHQIKILQDLDSIRLGY
jgi:hypothetical protein